MSQGGSVALNRICGVIAATDLRSLRYSAERARANLVELRIDYLEDHIGDPGLIAGLAEVIKLLKSRGKRVIVTLREASEGGRYSGRADYKLRILLELAKMGPDYIDVEAEFEYSKPLITTLTGMGVNVIISKHYLDHAPPEGEVDKLAAKGLELLNSVQSSVQSTSQPRAGPAELYGKVVARNSLVKIVYKCTGLDSDLSALELVRRYRERLIAFAAGESCLLSRLLAPFLGAPFTYALEPGSLRVAPGQLSVDEVIRLWRALRLV